MLSIKTKIVIISMKRVLKSDFFCGWLETSDNDITVNNNGNNGNNIILPFPSQYNDISHVYVDYLIYEGRNTTALSSVDDFKQSFELCHFLADTGFFDYLIKWLHASWSDFKSVIDQLHTVIQRQIYLTIPFVLLPVEYHDDTVFFTQWLVHNNGTYIVIDGDEYYCSKYHGYEGDNNTNYIFTSYHALHGKRYGNYGVNRYWERNLDTNVLTLVQEQNYNKRNNKHGKQQKWYVSGNVKEIIHYNDGTIVGDYKSWYDTGLPKYNYNYSEYGLETGIFKQWLPDGTIQDDLIIDDTNRHRLQLIPLSSPESSPLLYRVN